MRSAKMTTERWKRGTWRRRLAATSVLALIPLNAPAQERIPYARERFVIETPRVVLAPRVGGSIANERALNNAANAISSINEGLYSENTLGRLRQFDRFASLQDMRPRSQANAIEAIEISRPEAVWLQLGFKVRDLGGSRLIISAPDIERTQTFTAEDLAAWNGHSVLFVSSRLTVQLVHQGESRLSLEDLMTEIVVGESLQIAANDGNEKGNDDAAPAHAPCGRDDRVASQHPFVGRLTPEPCTAFLLEDGVAITAGHCMRYDRDLQQVEFNVPGHAGASAAVQDTYPIVPMALDDCSDCIAGQELLPGQDWAVFRLRDVNGRNAHRVQGGGFRVASQATVAASGNVQATVVGFGEDRFPPTADRTQQTAGGLTHSFKPVVSDYSWMNHLVDAAGGNSGSPLFFTDSDGRASALGIHVGGWCEPPAGYYNDATTFAVTKLRDAVTRLTMPSPP